MNSDLDNFIKSPKLSSKSIAGTSFHDVTIRTTLGKLKQILGEPNGQYCEKTGYSWNCELATGEVFTVYDWKSFRIIRNNDTVDFHIGGFNKEDTIKAQRILLKELREING